MNRFVRMLKYTDLECCTVFARVFMSSHHALQIINILNSCLKCLETMKNV